MDIDHVTNMNLWLNTYKGPDIDYIQIKADDGGTSSATGRCSYNYHVVMIQGRRRQPGCSGFNLTNLYTFCMAQPDQFKCECYGPVI